MGLSIPGLQNKLEVDPGVLAPLSLKSPAVTEHDAG